MSYCKSQSSDPPNTGVSIFRIGFLMSLGSHSKRMTGMTAMCIVHVLSLGLEVLSRDHLGKSHLRLGHVVQA